MKQLKFLYSYNTIQIQPIECYQIKQNGKKLQYKEKLEGKGGGLTILLEGCSQKGITKKGCIQKKNQIAIKLK